MQKVEEWRAVPTHPNYEVSDHGRVRSLDQMVRRRHGLARKKGRILRPIPHSGGYHHVQLADRQKVLIHVLVAATFIGPRPDGLIVCHKDDDKRRNVPDNLYYGTYGDNMADAWRNGKTRFQVTPAVPKRARPERNKYQFEW